MWMLCDSLCELGFDQVIVQVVEVIFDVCDCLDYVVYMIVQVVERVLNCVEVVQLCQNEFELLVKVLKVCWDEWFENLIELLDVCFLVIDICEYLDVVL